MLQLLPQPVEPADEPAVKTAPDRAYVRLAAQIQALVTRGEFAVGGRLPAERALAERFDVSRTALREAIIALELQGVVEVRGGSGIYVCEPKPGVARLPAAQEAGAGPFELLRARSLIESEIAALAATTRTDADLDRIFEALTTMRDQVTDKSANEAADRRFHLYIAQSTGNSVLLATVTSMWDQARGPIWDKIEQHFHTQALRQASQEDHQRIFSALVAGDAHAARQAMRAHLERVIGEFAQGWR
ncbi:FadR/GntR family transcriptional regulator [Achromobacter kerstersii]|uniref:FadR/GntR family transcriptional regulator n=1 Tax=Achromobacter kerstersii TaxID=1353890 RepID=UPI0006BEE650|nr:FadR/GntR family transcriptional regulator [Achromobacter kerstersii]CUI53506.1 L-lactate utilization operon repressor [Achromobacter kerstersii]